MLKKSIGILITLLGGLLGFSLVSLVLGFQIFNINSRVMTILIYVFVTLGFCSLFYILSDKIIKAVLKLTDKTEKTLVKIPPMDIVFGAIGLLFGLILSFFITIPLRQFNVLVIGGVVSLIVTVIIYVVLGIVGVRLMLRYKDDIMSSLPFKNDAKSKIKNSKSNKLQNKVKGNLLAPKIIDTSVIIDGRILNVVDSGFIEGDFIISNYVLEELQFIADSADELKRERGRRGLDIVKELQSRKNINVIINDNIYEEAKEVDIKLLKLSLELGGKIVTNDYNLNKLAHVQGIPVLNINDLANAVKTIVIPGEKMKAQIIKEGKEKDQGLAYLDDGTMIVVEEAKHLIGQEVVVIVTTMLQTAAGKMIFARPVND